MKKSPLILALALTLPLILYGVPYAYASVASSSYVVFTEVISYSTPYTGAFAHCNSGDYATGGGGEVVFATSTSFITRSEPLLFTGTVYELVGTGQQPNAWTVEVATVNSLDSGTLGAHVWVVCQSPITVAGIGVPEFGQLYIAIALGALVYFLMARRLVSTSKTSVTPS